MLSSTRLAPDRRWNVELLSHALHPFLTCFPVGFVRRAMVNIWRSHQSYLCLCRDTFKDGPIEPLKVFLCQWSLPDKLLMLCHTLPLLWSLRLLLRYELLSVPPFYLPTPST